MTFVVRYEQINVRNAIDSITNGGCFALNASKRLIKNWTNIIWAKYIPNDFSASSDTTDLIILLLQVTSLNMKKNPTLWNTVWNAVNPHDASNVSCDASILV